MKAGIKRRREDGKHNGGQTAYGYSVGEDGTPGRRSRGGDRPPHLLRVRRRQDRRRLHGTSTTRAYRPQKAASGARQRSAASSPIPSTSARSATTGRYSLGSTRESSTKRPGSRPATYWLPVLSVVVDHPRVGTYSEAECSGVASAGGRWSPGPRATVSSTTATAIASSVLTTARCPRQSGVRALMPPSIPISRTSDSTWRPPGGNCPSRGAQAHRGPGLVRGSSARGSESP